MSTFFCGEYWIRTSAPPDANRDALNQCRKSLNFDLLDFRASSIKNEIIDFCFIGTELKLRY